MLSSSSLFLVFLVSLVEVGFFVNVYGISGRFVSRTDGLLGLSDFTVTLCIGFGRRDDKPEPAYRE